MSERHVNSEGVVLDYPNDGAPLIAKPVRIPDAENDANLIANLFAGKPRTQ